MTLKHLSFTKTLVALSSLGAFLSSGDEWALLGLVVAHLVYEYLSAAELGRRKAIVELLENLDQIPGEISSLRADLVKVQDHVKNLQLSKLHRS